MYVYVGESRRGEDLRGTQEVPRESLPCPSSGLLPDKLPHSHCRLPWAPPHYFPPAAGLPLVETPSHCPPHCCCI